MYVPKFTSAVAPVYGTYPVNEGKVAKEPSPLTYCDTVPAPVTAKVPEVVTGLFVTVNAEGIVKPTDVTVPGLDAIVQDLSADKSYVTPLIVNVRLVGAYNVESTLPSAFKNCNDVPPVFIKFPVRIMLLVAVLPVSKTSAKGAAVGTLEFFH